MRLCAPSQSGGVFVRLHPHQATSFASGQTVTTGVNGVPACDPSQNGWLFERPHAHHDRVVPACSLST